MDTIPLPNLKDAMEVLGNEGVQQVDIYNNLKVLELGANEIKLRSHSLKELGFLADVAEIIKYSFLVGETTDTLHRCGVLAQAENPFQNIMKKLECSPQLHDEISAACIDPDQLPLKELRERIIKCIAVHNLQFPKDKLTELNTSHSLLRNCCVSDIQRTIKILTEELNIPVETIQNDLNLLRQYPEDLAQIIKMTEEYRLDLKFLISKYSFILKKPAADVALICRALCDYGVTSAQIMHCPEIFNFSPEYVLNCITAVSQWQDFSTLKLERGFLRVITHFKRANLRLVYLKNAGFERCNVSMLISKEANFKQCLYHVNDVKAGKELVHYISTVLDVSFSDVLPGLRHHPLFPDASVSNVKSVLNYLLVKGFTKRQILNGIALVVYPKWKVAKAWNMLPKLEIVQPFVDWVDSDYILHLLLYVIEKGECIFLKPASEMEPNKSLDTTKKY